MPYPFSDAFRSTVQQRCASFTRMPEPPGGTALKRAAVAITLLEAADGSGEAAFLLTRRAASLRGHAGQWALPGGRCEADETLADGALRELSEEVGLRLGGDSVLGMLDAYPTRSGYLVTPAVIWAGPSPALYPDPAEVASVHRVALSDLMQENAVSFTRIPESDRRVVGLRINGSIVHAPTAAMLYQFRELLAGRTTRVADLEQPVFAWR